jgi:hypothetical protein
MVTPSRRRTRFLAWTAVVLIALNCLSGASRLVHASRTWVVHYPSLESYQLAHPFNILFSSEGVDQRLPSSSFIAPFDHDSPSMFRDILACRPERLLIESAFVRPQMPTRFYVTTSGSGRPFATVCGPSCPLAM